MSALTGKGILRRSFLVGGGSLVLSFSLQKPVETPIRQAQETPEPRQPAPQKPELAQLPGSLADAPMLDAWIRIDAEGIVTVFTGKAELGQGIKTALIQVAAEQLYVDPATVRLVTADTDRTVDEGYTSGSQSMSESGTAILHAAAQIRDLLIGLAAGQFSLPAEELRAEEGAVVASDGRRIGYGALVSDTVLHVEAQPASRLKDPGSFTVIGTPMKRVDIPAKVTGGVAYVHDLRLPGMVHARVVRPPSPGASLRDVNPAGVEGMPGVMKVVRDGSFLAVVAEREFQAVTAMHALAAAASWETPSTLFEEADLFPNLERMPAEQHVILDASAPMAPAVKTLEAAYRRRYQMHASIGPSCAVAQFQDGALTVWSHAQGMFPLRSAISEMLGLASENVHCIHLEGAGCYGHNGADDAAADAALIARALPGKPVRVQWMREQEHQWEPYGSAMTARASGSLDGSGMIVGWQYEVRSSAHSTRPGGAGRVLAGQHLATPFAIPPPRTIPQPAGGGDRNAIPLYHLPNARVTHHFVPAMPLRVSALRGLGAYLNVFAVESFMDELAAAAGADPVEFRLRHLQDERARDVVRKAATRFGWSSGEKLASGRGRGFGFARYKNLAAYAAVAVEVAVERESGRVRVVRAVAAIDSGQAVNPDGIRNQTEGGILQSTSWTLYEAVTFDRQRVTSQDWSTYPILRFGAVPERVDVDVIDRPGEPFLGTGEAAQGPAAGAIGNAISTAIGVRMRDLPITRERIKSALGV